MNILTITLSIIVFSEFLMMLIKNLLESFTAYKYLCLRAIYLLHESVDNKYINFKVAYKADLRGLPGVFEGTAYHKLRSNKTWAIIQIFIKNLFFDRFKIYGIKFNTQSPLFLEAIEDEWENS